MEVSHEQIVARAQFFCHAQAQLMENCMILGSFHVKSPKKVPFWPRPPSISAKIGEPMAPHDRNMYAQF